MFLKLLRAKIHRATVTQAELEYVGSITIDQDLLDASGIMHWEEVLVADLDNAARFRTYAIAGQRGSGTICINGAAAKLVNLGDRIIIMAFAYVTPEEAPALKPKVVLVDGSNRVSRML